MLKGFGKTLAQLFISSLCEPYSLVSSADPDLTQCCVSLSVRSNAVIRCRCFARLEAPPVRVCGYDTPFPLVFESVYLPTVSKVVAAIRQSVDY